MKVAKWGNSLAVRLPASLVVDLGLKEGDQIDLIRNQDGAFCVYSPNFEDRQRAAIEWMRPKHSGFNIDPAMLMALLDADDT